LFTYGVCVRKSHALPTAATAPSASGWNPRRTGGTKNTQSMMPPTHEFRRPVDRFMRGELWCTACDAHMNGNTWLARCDQ
jgi:hypothetical protein